MLNSKQRAKLRAQASGLDPVFYVGNSGISDELLNQLENVLNARELIKISVQDNCEFKSREVADIIAPKLDAEVVAVIGRKIVLFRVSKDPKKRKISFD